MGLSQQWLYFLFMGLPITEYCDKWLMIKCEGQLLFTNKWSNVTELETKLFI